MNAEFVVAIDCALGSSSSDLDNFDRVVGIIKGKSQYF